MESSPLELSVPATVARADGDTRAAPVAKGSRIADMDIIRGMALFGVLMMNLAEVFRIPYFGHGGPEVDASLLERIVVRVELMVLAGKAMTLFSILFGAGLAIFWERASARGPGATWLLSRRLFFLALFGLAHGFLIWNGDILFLYALSGLVALLFLRAPTWVLLAVAFVSWGWSTVVGPNLPAVWAFAIRNPGPSHYDEALRVYGTGTYLEILRFRASELVRFEPFTYILNLPDVLTKMLLGIAIWRSKVLDLTVRETHLRKLRWIAFTGITLTFGYMLFRWIQFEIYHPPPVRSPWKRVLFLLCILSCALGYGAGLLLLLRRANWRRWLGVFAPLGRMAFTNYLTQSIVFSTVFYSYGLALIGKVSNAQAALMGIVFYTLQGFASAIWLRHFRFGPFEWAWRSLTYGRLQPMRRALEANDV
ncbi:DUF418 domain-containing protein [Pendulispora brunnea]|uniref:DUF418 domain-containing protein n=1 Tax=Pendulispora brunnea TaxID=2905690 RepID=A0ABZ2KMB1_9BACT